MCLLRLFIFKLNSLCLQSEEKILTYLNSLCILGGGHGAGMAGLCARDSVLLSRLVQQWFVLLDNLSKAMTEHCLTESQFSYQQSRQLSLQICLNWLYQLQFSTFWCIISRPLQSLIPGDPGSLERFSIWPEAWTFLIAFESQVFELFS